MSKLRFLKLFGFAAQAAHRPEGDTWDRFKAFLRMFWYTFKGRYRPKKRNLFIGTLVLIYVISPLDLIPGILLDDLAIIYFAFKYFGKEIDRYIIWEKTMKYQTITATAEIVDQSGSYLKK